MKEYINDALKAYRVQKKYPWHMPGHKRQACFETAEDMSNQAVRDRDIWSEIFARDYTEAKDLDDMHSPKLFIKDSLNAVSRIYGTYKTYMLVNGSTVGILAAIFGCTGRGQNILAARNCHKSVYNAIELRGLNPTYIMPEYIDNTGILGYISPMQVKEALEKLEKAGQLPAAVVITSPTYEGIISDVKGIADVVHGYGILLIVDEAQGAHFEFIDRQEYRTAMEEGADVVIESLHKTMPSLTQTSLLHIINGSLSDRIEKYLQMFQTSSPSYIFMQSMEKAISYGDSHRQEFLEYINNLEKYRRKYDKLKYIRLFEPKCLYDIGKMVFVIKEGTYIDIDGDAVPLTGTILGDILADKYGQVVEMTALNYIISMTSVSDRQEAYDKLYDTLKEIDEGLAIYSNQNCFEKKLSVQPLGMVQSECRLSIPEFIYSANTAVDMDAEIVHLENADGRISADYVYAYPPGIPVLVPGEKIDAVSIENIKNMIAGGLNVEGIRADDERVVSMAVLKD